MGALQDVVRDEPLRREIEALTRNGVRLPHSEELGVSANDVAMAVIVDRDLPRRRRRRKVTPAPKTEAVVRMFGRPVLFIRNGKIELPRSKELRSRLLPSKGHLEARIPAVGRLEFRGHPSHPWGGTAWMIDDGVIVTNRHVAELVAERGPRGFPMKRNPVTDEPMQARIDFLEEDRSRGVRANSREVAVKKVIFIERESRKRPDVAFMVLESDGDLPAPIPVLESDLANGANIAVVGYPAPDPEGVPSPAAARRIFQNRYEVKRLAPGTLMVSEPDNFYFTHDATTLGGNSGSVVLDLETGAAAGLHFMGDLGEANYAVKASTLRDALARARNGRKPRARVPPRVRRPDARPAVETVAASSYANREGFDPSFLGPGLRVDLPVKETAKRDLLRYTDPQGKKRSDLPYTHFSVAMSVKRKLCLWSAVNINGRTSKPDPRPRKWLVDPRIAPTAQTLPNDAEPSEDVYGDAPRFARGHMTRREDPIWGPQDIARQGNVDSMHYTNVVPQQQSFNGKIWNNLEDYALHNAREDRMRISVLTGPIFEDDDPVMYGTKIPVDFWKVIAFVHDETKKLTATGYILSQENDIPHEEFVFGDFDGTRQVQIRTIERRTGLSFGAIARRDPKRGEEAIPQPLSALEQIRFV
jgi:endonuclease G, mitochondrial